ncbi:hypothetical protein XPU_1586, partial [Xanthomonas arboricola pv. pruni str. MAFF 311562]
MSPSDSRANSRSIGRQQARHRDDERRQALRALLMSPLMKSYAPGS